MAGEMETVTIKLAGEDVVLRPSHWALTKICDRYGGLTNAIHALSQAGIDAQVEVIAVGARMSVKRREAVPAEIYDAGLFDLLPKLVDFLTLLGTGGRRTKKADHVEASAGRSRGRR